jgi:hypothetical protein
MYSQNKVGRNNAPEEVEEQVVALDSIAASGLGVIPGYSSSTYFGQTPRLVKAGSLRCCCLIGNRLTPSPFGHIISGLTRTSGTLDTFSSPPTLGYMKNPAGKENTV